MSLGSEQRLFTKMVGQLIGWAYENGYELSIGDAFRDPRAFGEVGESKAYGHASSNHKRHLAIDFNLFINGEYQGDTKAHEPLGEYWESIGGSWGGRFNDGNHYSLEYQGYR